MADNISKSRPWFFKLHWQVLIALVTGVAFGWLAPSAAESIGFLGDLFLRLLKMIIIPLIFTSLITGVTGLGGKGRFGRMFSRTIAYYVVTSLLAIVALLFVAAGLTAALSSPNLSSGIRQSVDLYQYGMAWLMLAMLIGRILPVLVFDRAAGTPTDESPSGTGEPACPYLV